MDNLEVYIFGSALNSGPSQCALNFIVHIAFILLILMHFVNIVNSSKVDQNFGDYWMVWQLF